MQMGYVGLRFLLFKVYFALLATKYQVFFIAFTFFAFVFAVNCVIPLCILILNDLYFERQWKQHY